MNYHALLLSASGPNNAKFSKLYGTGNDAQALKVLLPQKFPNIRIKEGLDLEEGQAKDKIKDFLQELQDNDRALLYFSGHGDFAQNPDAVRPHDHRECLIFNKGNIFDTELHDLFKEHLMHKQNVRVYFMADCCFAGGFNEGYGPEFKDGRRYKFTLKGRNMGYREQFLTRLKRTLKFEKVIPMDFSDLENIIYLSATARRRKAFESPFFSEDNVTIRGNFTILFEKVFTAQPNDSLDDIFQNIKKEIQSSSLEQQKKRQIPEINPQASSAFRLLE